jgi:hypothetical protein
MVEWSWRLEIAPGQALGATPSLRIFVSRKTVAIVSLSSAYAATI